MPNITRNTHSQLTEEINIDILPSDYMDEYKSQVKAQAKQANMPGFRKGLVPVGLIEKSHGKYFLSDIVMKKAEHEIMNYTKKENIQYVFQPILSETNMKEEYLVKNKTFHFTFLLGLLPDLDLDVIKKYAPKKYVVEVKDELVEEEINEIKSRYAKTEKVDSIPNGIDFMLNVNVFDAKTDDEQEPIFKEGIVRNTSLQLKMVKSTVGKKVGNSFEIKLASDVLGNKLDYAQAMLGFKRDSESKIPKKLRLVITSIHKVEPAQLDETFFKEKYHDKSVKTPEALREMVKKNIGSNYEKSSFNLWASELIEKMRQSLKMQYPDYFLEKWILNNKKETKKQSSAQDQPDKLTLEEEKTKYKHSLFNSILILNTMQKEKVEVNEKDMDDELNRTIENYFGMSGDFVHSYKDNMKKNQEFMTKIYHTVLDNKCLMLLREKYTTKETQISSKEFEALVKKHNQKIEKNSI